MKKIIIVWTIILVIIVAGLTYFGLRVKEKTIYELMEKGIVVQAKKYINKNSEMAPAMDELKIVDVDGLKDSGFDPKLESDCTGYVIIANTVDGFKYDPYIKCNKYTTKDYAN